MQTASFIDLDGTLVRGHTQLALLKHLFRHRIVSRRKVVLMFAKYGLLMAGLVRDEKSFREQGYQSVAGGCVDTLGECARHIVRADTLLRLRTGAADLVREEARGDTRCVLITAAPEEIARPVADALGFHDVIATRLESVDGVLTGKFHTPSPYGEGKRTLAERYCRQHGIDPSTTRAFADHESDLPLLEFAGHPHMVNPTRSLARIGRARGWPTINLDLPRPFATAPT